MYKNKSSLLLSASDVTVFMGCRHATSLDLMAAYGKLKAPPPAFESTLTALIEKGQEFEAARLAEIEAEGKKLVRISNEDSGAAMHNTLAAMKKGADVIYQARLEYKNWNGWADFLFKVDKPSALGAWSYEVEDTKFARHTKSSAILQICLYSQILTHLQETTPEHMHIRTPEGRQSFRTDDYMAYFNLVQKKLLLAINNENSNTYPDPVVQCDICRWWTICNQRRRDDDHLSFVAGLGSSQMQEIRKWGVNKLEALASLPMPLTNKPTRGSVETYSKLREQARLQLQSRIENKPIYELLSLQEEQGFYKLPEPSDGDMFFDFEGDPFIGTSGREYLFGWVMDNQYECLWATTDVEEKDAFETFIDRVMKVQQQHPGMHIYHFSAYEPSALKRLMGKYATREDEIDTLLRSGTFIDLHLVLKHAIRAGVESYSLKEMEKYHEFTRKRELRMVGQYKALLEGLLESGNFDVVDQETKDVVLDYNADDCWSTLSLRNWLESLRAGLIQKGIIIDRPPLQSGEAAESITDHQRRIQPLFDALTKNVPIEPGQRSAMQQARWLLAHMLDWYRREKKAFWWNYFRLRELNDEDLLDERDALSYLSFTGKRTTVKKSEVHYYTFPEQECDLKEGATVDYKGERVGSIYSLDFNHRLVGIKKGQKANDIHPTHIICSDNIENNIQEAAIIRMATWVSKHDINAAGDYWAGRALLLKEPPSLPAGIESDISAQEKAVLWVQQMNEGVLPIQGPPGTGKSYTAARMIVALIKSGKKVGITALSHKVITALMEKVHKFGMESGLAISMIQKSGEVSNATPANWVETDKNAVVEAALKKDAMLAAGTSFMWARPEFFQLVDVLFVDEAGQLSLIDTIALSHAGKTLVLLGDPQQLQQPQKGSHPDGTEVSALEHLLGDHQTILEGKGVFLDKTWRLHPYICDYVSELFYERRLLPESHNVNQRLSGDTPYQAPGIYVESVHHTGNKNSSDEEVAAVQKIVEGLLDKEVYYYDLKNEKIRLGRENIKIISPYNAQVNALGDAIAGIAVGTVDKFQGQEAAVIIFSMATSSPEDAPRGMEFLYSLNRLNVAVSRARAVFILVANPALFEPSCRTPQQIRLANALCRLVEKANHYVGD